MFILLIPKIPYMAELFHFILISQWFESEKLSKVLMDHLKVVMPFIINSNQNACGGEIDSWRCVTCNELIRYRKEVKRGLVFKIGFKKALRSCALVFCWLYAPEDGLWFHIMGWTMEGTSTASFLSVGEWLSHKVNYSFGLTQEFISVSFHDCVWMHCP